MARVTFYDVLGVDTDAAAAAIWPRSRIKSALGYSVDSDPTDLVKYMQSVLTFRAVRPGVGPDRVGLSAEVIVKNPPMPPSRPLVLTQMPDVAFYLQDTPAGKPARLFVTRGSGGVELVIEALPVEIRLSSDLLGALRTPAEEKANPGAGPDITLTDPFSSGSIDSLQVTLRDTGQSSIYVHLRVRMTEEMDFILEPAVVISIGPCRFSGLPCKGLHDVNFVPSPKLLGDHSAGEQALEWTRHRLDRFEAEHKYGGALTVRTVDLDNTRSPLKQLLEKMNTARQAQVEFVLEDIALPFAGMAALPIPSHGLLGLRREIKAGDSPKEAYGFAGAPVQIKVGDWRLLIEELLLQTPADKSDQFIFLKMALLFGSNTDSSHAATLGVTDEWTLQAGWRSPSGLKIFTIADATLKLWGAKVGWSIARFASKDPQYDWHEQLQLLVDLGLATKGTGSGVFKMRSLSGKHLEVVLRDVGWDLGEFSLGGLAFPEGVQFIFGNTVRLIVEELGWVTENNGGRYFSFTGGVSVFPGAGQPDSKPSTGAGSAAISEEKSKGGGIRFQRLRFLTSDTPGAASWLLDGITLSLRLGSSFSFTGFGMVSEFTENNHHYKEFAFGLQVAFKALTKDYKLGMQLYYGRVSGPADNFAYWVFGFQLSPIPCGTLELVDVRLVAAGNMMPNLGPPSGQAQNMRIWRWYKSNRGTAVAIPASRKLAAWKRKKDALAVGAGLGMALPVGKAVVLDCFLFIHDSDGETGLLIAAEVYMLKSKKPVGFGAIEIDFAGDRWGCFFGVELTAENILGAKIPFLGPLLVVKGTLYFGNKPATFALGQLNDQSTWLTAQVKISAFVNVGLLFAFCLQLVDGGPRGFGLVVSVKGGTSFGIGKITLYATFGLMAGVWQNESKVSGFVIWIKAGLRIKVFWIFTFGVSAKVEFDYLGPNPAYRRLGCEIRIETPWFLPDVTFRWEKIWSKSKPDEMTAVSTPLVSSGAIRPGDRTQEKAAVTPLTGGAIDEKATYNLKQLRALGSPTLPGGSWAGLTPVGVDSTIALNFKPSVDDQLSVGENTPSGVGTQKSNDLSTTYELVEASIRRRPRFGTGAGTWTTLLAPGDTRLETPADFASGADLEAHFTSAVSFQWDRDMQREGDYDPRRLLINASTPYTFLISNPEGDENIARKHPKWPCCQPPRQKGPPWHELNFSKTALGVRAPTPQKFSESESRLHWLVAKPPVVMQGIIAPSNWRAARLGVARREAGIFAALVFDEPARTCEIYAYWWPGSPGRTLVVETYQGLDLLDTQTFPLSSANPPGPIRLQAKEGMSSALLRLTGKPEDSKATEQDRTGWIEFIRMRYRGLREELDWTAQEQKCKARNKRTLDGGGKLAWLPNHDYEISVTTKVTLKHTKTGSQEARVRQKAVFRTKGLPGLNAVKRIGDELEPYVESTYPGPTPRTLYRSEPVALAFNENFNILLPVDRAPSPDNPKEKNQLLEWVLVVDKAGDATGGQRISQTSPDWVVAHRTIPSPVFQLAKVIDENVVYSVFRQAKTLDQFQVRFEAMVHRPGACPLPSPSLHRSQVLLHTPVDPTTTDSALQRWSPNVKYRVNVRRKPGAKGPLVERNPFAKYDYTAFDEANEGGGTGTPWRSANGTMRVQGSPRDSVRRYAVFGENTWNHVQIHTSVDPEGGAAGVAVGVAGLPGVTRAAMALVDEGTGHLKLVQRWNGTVTELTSKQLPGGVSAPYALEVIAFDDCLQARVGETVVEAKRGDIREGRLALVAVGGGAFSSLVVEPLDAYRFYFQTSRFVDFAEHIDSFGGEVTAIPVDTTGSGAATQTVASLWTATSTQVGTVMAAGASPEQRQRLFDRWVRGLALPLRQRTRELALSRLAGPGGSPLLLLESPEPLPFSTDVALTLKKRVVVPVFAPEYELAGEFPERGLMDLSEVADDLDFVDDTVRGSVTTKSPAATAGSARWLVRAVKAEEGLEYRVYQVSTRTNRAGRVEFSGKIVESIRSATSKGSIASPLTHSIAGMRDNNIALLDAKGALVGPLLTTYEVVYVQVPIRVLTNGDETHALIVPLNAAGNAPAPLDSGTYRLEFKLDRARYRSQTQDSTSNYCAQASLVARW